MTTLTVTPDSLRIELTPAERIAGLLRDLEVPLTAVTRATVEQDAVGTVRGLRSPGLALPGRRKIGTWRRRGVTSFVAVRRGEPALCLELEGTRFDRVLVGTDRAHELADLLDPGSTGWREEQVVVGTAPALAGTLTLPRRRPDAAPLPFLVLVSGSGPLDRDSNHPKLRFEVSRQLAHALADRGVASYRFDKRGVGASPGDWKAAGLHDNVDDVATAFDAMARRPELDPARGFVAGHSEGAILAGAVAARDPRVRGLVLLAPSARDGQEMLRWQTAAILPTLPRPVRGLLRLLRVDLTAKVAANHAKLRATTTDTARIGLQTINAKWFREYLAHDSRTDLARVTAPVLGITGAKDLQVDPADLEVLAEVAAGPVETHLVPDLTHALRRNPGKPSVSHYKVEVRDPVDPFVLTTVADWVERQSAVNPAPVNPAPVDPAPVNPGQAVDA